MKTSLFNGEKPRPDPALLCRTLGKSRPPCNVAVVVDCFRAQSTVDFPIGDHVNVLM